MNSLNLPLSDRAGRGAIEARIQLLIRDLHKYGQGVNTHEFERTSRLLDLERKKFHKLYGVKEHPTESPLHPTG